ncbi:3'-5' exonuclease domain [Dillenia turbinata]|uniref:DNA-directed DNA polymerase n=1 Tax=Dillenia turbinata TaxID=194707 RepID=A0AAN8ZQZ5_9MAGN
MGVSSQTPCLKSPFCPSNLCLSRYCLLSSCASKPIQRLEVHLLCDNSNVSFLNTSMFRNSLLFTRSSCSSHGPFREAQRYKESEFRRSHPKWKLYVQTGTRYPCTSTARMLPINTQMEEGIPCETTSLGRKKLRPSWHDACETLKREKAATYITRHSEYFDTSGDTPTLVGYEGYAPNKMNDSSLENSTCTARYTNQSITGKASSKGSDCQKVIGIQQTSWPHPQLNSWDSTYSGNGGANKYISGPHASQSAALTDKAVGANNSMQSGSLARGTYSQINGSSSSYIPKHNEETSLEDYVGNNVNGEPVTVQSSEPETYVVPITNHSSHGPIQSDLRKRLCSIYDKVLVVADVSAAKKVVKLLTTKYRHFVHACDTEVAKIDVKQETPVEHGELICFSIYSGPKANFGNGKSCIWVDVLDGGRDVLHEFAAFFEDPSVKKVWHNYGFDSHVIRNYGIEPSGFHADTMHMARLWDSSRRTDGGYSLEGLTGDPDVMSWTEPCKERELMGKISMKTIFGRRKVKKDGFEGKMINVAPVEELQRKERKPWICYSALDSISTLQLYEQLKKKLSGVTWNLEQQDKGNMFDFYEEYWQPFGELLVKMEAKGMLVDQAYLAAMEKVAYAEQEVAANRFRKWASKYCPDAKHMNVGSDAQLRQLFFGGIENRKDPNEFLPEKRTFKVPNTDRVIEDGKKSPTKYRNITLERIDSSIETDMYTASGWPSVSGDALKMLAGKISAEFDFMDEASDFATNSSAGGQTEYANDESTEKRKPTKDVEIDTSAYGTAYAAFGGGQEGKGACHAIAALCEVCSIDSLISNFLLPLQSSHVASKNGRIHCSLNINTETGRLSARRPNLQNQPALEKDRYKIRQAFVAAPGKSLIVADYGQLELRILAHLTKCKSMLEAFKAGGDFHSRTAMNMYPYIREAIDKKEVLLEWNPQPGEEKSPVPLLKDVFASERRKAKMLNFSIAYGKTPVGLARDWKVSLKEARKTVELWYKERQEVLNWQEERKKEAILEGRVHTLLGRARKFPSTANATAAQKGHIERAAINTPVQGSAADVAMCAMLEISRNACLKELKWSLLLQVHDEVILEGPTESAEEARAIVVDCMSKPFYGTNWLSVDLAVDAKCAKNWYAAK